MKARIPPQRRLNRQTLGAVDDYIRQKMHNERIRFLKIVVFVLNRHFKLGNKGGDGKLSKFMKLVLKTLKKYDGDPALWVNLDKVVIDELKLPFSREDYEEREEAMEQSKRKK